MTKLWDMTELTCTRTFTDSHTDEVTSIVMKVRLLRIYKLRRCTRYNLYTDSCKCYCLVGYK